MSEEDRDHRKREQGGGNRHARNDQRRQKRERNLTIRTVLFWK